MSRYCVIGAGAAGISALQQLVEAGHDVECFEKTGRVGGHWHTDYDALHLITSRDMTHFPDFPMPADYPHFPSRDQVRRYIESYAEHHGLDATITFETEVVAVEPVEGDGATGAHGWRVTTSRRDEGEFDAVLVANGHLWSARVPGLAADFTGVQCHSADYRNTSSLADGRTLVVGCGNSGCDIAVDVAQHRHEVDIAVRAGHQFQPKMCFGMPRSEIPFLAGFSPADQDLISRLLARVSIGQNTDYPGMPAPASDTIAGGPATVNDLLLYWIHHGRIGVRPGIDHITGTEVHFSDGTTQTYDSVVWATGFDVKLPFLADSAIRWESEVPVRHAGGILPSGAENLYFVGMIAPRGPQINIYGEQSRLIVRMLRLAEHGQAVGARFAQLQDDELRIDIVRDVWNDQMADTARILDTLESVTREVPR